MMFNGDKSSGCNMALHLETGAITLLEDERCGSAYNSFVDDAGDLHVVGDSYSGFYYFFGEDPESVDAACVLTIPAGSLAFAEDLYVDLLALTGAQAVYTAFHREDRALVAPLWLDPTPPSELVETPDDYWTLERWTFSAIDLDTGTSTPIEGLPVGGVSNVTEYRVDDTLFVQLYDFTGESTRATMYRIDGATAIPSFSGPGDFWALERLR
jgi:hypothetical protein